MPLDQLLAGHVEDPRLDLRNFDWMESPVQTSSEIRISPSPNGEMHLIRKTKKPGKRSRDPHKMVWEFLQYKILNRVFAEVEERSGVPLWVPEPRAVFPAQYQLITQFSPGFVLARHDRIPTDIYTIHEDKMVPSDYVAAFLLGALNRVKERNGIFHSDYDLRHVLFDPISGRMAMIDLENTRYATDHAAIEAESENMRTAWFAASISRGFDEAQLHACYQKGRTLSVQPSYTTHASNVAEELGIGLKISTGYIDNHEVGLTSLRGSKRISRRIPKPRSGDSGQENS